MLESGNGPRSAVTATIAKGAPEPALETARQIAELNLCALTIVRERCVAFSPAGACRRGPHAVDSLHSAWRMIGEDALRRLAQTQYLLVDARFADASAWAEAIQRVGQRPAAGEPAPSAAAIGGSFADPAHAPFIVTLFLYAWHLSRIEPLTAELALGASSATIAQIRPLSLRTIEQLARHCASWVELRWENRPSVWAALLGAASRDDREVLRLERMKGLQRLAGACCALEPWTPAADGAAGRPSGSLVASSLPERT